MRALIACLLVAVALAQNPVTVALYSESL
jgi:hypothetical protein